jgi:hypothetical protein
MNDKRMQQFIVKFSINYPSGKKWITEEKAFGITKLGAIDTIKWIYNKRNISIISVEPTGIYSAFAVYGDNHTIGER